ncbi:MAG: amino acid ABC transporter permease [Candidatus Thiodiazotropha sp.]
MKATARDLATKIRRNLFSTWYNVVITLTLSGVVAVVGTKALRWILIRAQWQVITTNFRVLMTGRYPKDEVWRIIVSILIVFTLAVITRIVRKQKKTDVYRWITVAWILSLPVITILLRGFGEDNNVLPGVKSEIWSGLMLTLVLAVIGITASFPLGILLALGRRSKLPVFRLVSTAYIELIRGVPLISVLFMSQLLLPLFLPPQIRLGTVVRALTGMTMFSAAYTAENIRGGLASVPKGQYEAARVLGLNSALVMILVVLPQALRAVIPALVGQFISLFKDTTLVVIVGLLDLLGIAKAVTGQVQFIGLHQELYCFVALVFFICCYSMSRASRRLEIALGVGNR